MIIASSFIITYLQCSVTVGSVTGRAFHPVKKLDVGLLVVMIRSFARLTAPVVTTTSIILSSNKIQDGDVHCLRFNGYFPGGPGLAGTSMSGSKFQTDGAVNWKVRLEKSLLVSGWTSSGMAEDIKFGCKHKCSMIWSCR